MRNVTKTTFFSFIFPIPLSYTSQPSFSIVLCANQKLEQKTCNTHATLLWPHLRYDTWDVRKFCLLPEEISSISSLKICIFSLLNINISNLLYFIIGVIVKILFNMPSHHGPGVDVFVVTCQAASGGDQNNCGARNWSTAGHKRRKQKICCFYKDEFFSWRDVEHLSLR